MLTQFRRMWKTGILSATSGAPLCVKIDRSISCQPLTASGSRWACTRQPFRDNSCDSPQCRFRDSSLETRSKDGTATALKYV